MYITMEVESLMTESSDLQTTQPTIGRAVTANTNCCANCVETSRPQQWVPDLQFWGNPAIQTRCMVGATPHKIIIIMH